jgi:hypothetical protein
MCERIALVIALAEEKTFTTFTMFARPQLVKRNVKGWRVV